MLSTPAPSWRRAEGTSSISAGQRDCRLCLADKIGSRNTMNRRDLLIRFANGRAPADTPNNVRRFSNGVLLTHENKQVKFYDDLIHGKQFISNFMYANCTGACPLITEKLVQVYKALKYRMSENLFIYSFTLYPEQDDPAALKKFAQMHGALLPGWTF